MNFKDLQEELPMLLGWKIHSLERVNYGFFFEDYRIYDKFYKPIFYIRAPLCGYNLLLLIWGDDEDLIQDLQMISQRDMCFWG